MDYIDASNGFKPLRGDLDYVLAFFCPNSVDVMSFFSNLNTTDRSRCEGGVIVIAPESISENGRVKLARGARFGAGSVLNIEDIIVPSDSTVWSPAVTVLEGTTLTNGASLTFRGGTCFGETHFPAIAEQPLVRPYRVFATVTPDSSHPMLGTECEIVSDPDPID